MATKIKEEQVSTDKHDPKQDVAAQPGKKGSSPRLPHEVDESFDSQEGEPRKVIKQAFDDIAEGQIEPDRRGIPGVGEVHRKNPKKTTQEDIPASSRIPPSTPKK